MAEKSFTVHWRRVVEKQSHAGGQVTTWSRTVRDEKKLGQSKVFKGSHAALTLERFEPGCDGDPLSTGRSAPGAALRQITFIYGASEAGCSSPYLILKSSNRMLLCLQIFFRLPLSWSMGLPARLHGIASQLPASKRPFCTVKYRTIARQSASGVYTRT